MKDKTANILESYRLSPGQRHLWQQQSGDGASYRVQCAVSIEGELSVGRLKNALKNVVWRHEILRTVFQTPSGMTIPAQSVCQGFEPSIIERDLANLNQDEQEKAIEAIFQESKKQPFDLENGELMSVSLIRLSNLKHILILALPALCADIKSLINLTKEIAVTYRSDAAESDEPFQSADFAEWHNEILAGEVEDEGQNFWREQKINADFKLYCEDNELKNADFAPQVLTFDIKPETAARIKTLSDDSRVSASDFLLTCWQVLLYRLSGHALVTVGMSCDGRKFEEMDEAIGLFAEFVALSGEIKDEIRFDELLKQTCEGTDKAENWQEFFDWKQMESSFENEWQTPFLSFCFDFLKLPSEFRADEIVFKVSRQYSCLDCFKLKLSCVETEESLITQFYFDSARYQNQTIERLAENFHQLLESAVSNLNAEIGALEIFSDAERRRLLEEFNQTQFDYRKNVAAHQLFEEVAAETPDKTAVVCENRQISYGELNALANQLARHLRTLGVGPEILCAICVERSVEMVVGILAVLKTGGCYVPLDPDYPKDRLAYMLEDARPKLLLTSKNLLTSLPQNNAEIVLLDTNQLFVSEQQTENINAVTAPETLAYIIYTSGSTGKPKGVMITHGNLGHYAQTLPASLGLEKSDRYLHTASISFSSSVRQLMVPLSIGATVVIATSERIKNPLALFELVRRQDVTVLDLVPSYWRNCLYALDNSPDETKRSLKNTNVRLVLSASEPLPGDVPRELAAKLKHDVLQINMLGQTETTGIISVYPIDPSGTKTGIVPVGRPIGNTQIYLLDSNLRPAAFGASGEIYIGGANIGRGYLNHPELSAEKFIPNPFANDDKSRLYKTGDLGRYGSDGQIEFLGRIDSQVKIRGHRVEPGEIEAALRRHEGVRDAVVAARDDAQDGQKLVAYVVPKTANAATIEGRERYRLPNNMSIVQQNRHETDFFYQQIFIDQTNFKHGIELRDGDCVVDVGANIGFFTMFVQQLWKDVKVFAFEPIPAIFETLKINSTLYGKNTELFRCGLAEESKEVVFTYYPNSSTQSGRYADEQEEREVLRSIIGNQQAENGSKLTEQYFDRLVEDRVRGEKITCSLKTLSQVIRENKIEQIDLLKIDAEKSEFDVLRGIEKADWKKIRQLVIEAHDIDGQLKKLVNLLEEQGFTVVAEEDSYIKGSGLYNVYAVRAAENIESPLRQKSVAPYPVRMLNDEILNGNELRQYLQSRLPKYLIPSNFILLESLPMTPNGKVDRQALPDPDENRQVTEKGLIAPTDELERSLVGIWEQLLGVQPVGIRDNFFDLGGHSLLAVRLFSQIEKLFGKNLPLATLFESPTIERLADLLRQKGWKPVWSSLVPIQPNGTKRPFFCIHALGGNVLEYHLLASHLGSDQPFYGLQSLGLDENQSPHLTIEEMAAHYIKEMRAVQPEGPYLLGGRSLGGTVAFEMACQLRAENQEVALLALLDTDPMGYHKLLPNSRSHFSKAEHFIKRAKGHIANLQQLTIKQRVNYFQGKFRYVPGKIKNKLWKAAYKFYLLIDRPLPKLLQSVEEFNFMAVMNYLPKIYPGQVTLFWANEDLRGTYDVEAGWNFLATGGIEIINIPGNHLDIVKEPYVRSLAEKLKVSIDKANVSEKNNGHITSPASSVALPSEENADYEQWINYKPSESY